MTRFKFCGITRREDAETAARLGASFVGVILSESPRQIAPHRAAEVLAAAKPARGVAVFRHAPVPAMIEDARIAGANVMQLHGRFSADDIAIIREQFEGEIWQVFPMDSDKPQLPENWSELADLTDAVVLDTSARGDSGGTGVPFDWAHAGEFAAGLSERTTIVLAGGLTALNVVEAIRRIAPAVVDVSTGIESAPGIKDPEKMRAFAEAVRSASIV